MKKMFLFDENESVAAVGTLYTKLVGVTTPGAGHADWQITFTGNADGHTNDGAVDANIELFVGGFVVPDFKTFVETKLHWLSDQAQPVGSPIGMLALTFILTDVPALTTIEVYGKATGGVESPFDTGGIDFFTLTLAAIRV